MKGLTVFLAFAAMMLGCQSEMSLSKFIALNENKPGFKSFTISSNVLKIRDGETDPDIKQALDNIKSIQLLIYNSEDRTVEEKDSYAAQAIDIVKGERYESMMEIVKDGQAFYISAKKKGDKFQEIVLLGSGEEAFFLGRIIGEIEEEKGIKLMQAIDFSQMAQGISLDF
jgi:hypothetical protein